MKYALVFVFLFAVALPTFAAGESALLNVPFTAQAPFGDWSWPWSDFCEEASIAMSYSYVTGKQFTARDFAIEMLKLAIYELQTFGYEKDTNAAETLRMLTDYYRYPKARIVENPTQQLIRDEISKGNLVIIPAAGKLLQNPYFRAPGPRHHTLVIKGFDQSDFIVNDPGTRFGNGYRYSRTNLMEAMHDFVPEPAEITTGRKAVIVIDK
ncbi:MAG: C39 family peptidase [Candidatus Sungbacteria bacterium]|uniref:C39 family peptidase n=1 Tax=Candidatus Sungiibacteriota bacterium TaxID=2750080 RepID=A0A931SBW0_9BACT|nr:C39 family peptidase [Candidatus Sungbacteria bacterium]